jgi:hypothetical protein
VCRTSFRPPTAAVWLTGQRPESIRASIRAPQQPRHPDVTTGITDGGPRPSVARHVTTGITDGRLNPQRAAGGSRRRKRRLLTSGTVRIPLALYALAVVVRAVAAATYPDPAYPESYYYVDVARAIAAGHGLNVDFIWIFA